MSGDREWNGDVYADNTDHHREFDDHIVDRLTLTATDRVLDLGCGVGDFTRSIDHAVPDGSVLGVDASASMIDNARAAQSSERPAFAVRRAQDLGADFAPDSSFDVIVSVACLHWVPGDDHPDVLANLARLLAPGGRLVLSFGGFGNVDAARVLINRHSAELGGLVDPWYFPHPDDYLPLAHAAGFSSETTTATLLEQLHRFDTFPALEGWFDSQVLLAFDGALDDATKAELRRRVFADAIDELHRPDGTYHQQYVRMVLTGAHAPS